MKDYIVRATAAGGQIRAFAATTRNLVEEARSRHNTSPVATAALGRLMTGGVMMGVMMKGDKDLLTLQVRGDGPIQGITVTADSKGTVKGYVENPMVLIPANSVGKLDVKGAVGRGSLTVIKDLGLKDPYVGQIDLPSGEIAEDLTYYFAVSEQVPSTCGLGVLMNREDNTVKQAGGFIVQLMPGTQDEVIDQLEKNLSDVKSVTSMLEAGNSPEDILNHLLGNMELEILDTIPASFSCNCSWDRVSRALISLGQKELQSLIDEGQPVELKCHFCNEAYQFTVEDLKEMLKVAAER